MHTTGETKSSIGRGIGIGIRRHTRRHGAEAELSSSLVMKHHDGLLNTAAATVRPSRSSQSKVHIPEVVCDITQILGVRKVVQEHVNIRPILLVHEAEGDVQIWRTEKPFHSTSGVLCHVLHRDVVGRHGCRCWGCLNKGEACD